MFDFEKLEVYQVARGLVNETLQFMLTDGKLDPYIKEEWKKASMGIITNLSEGTSRMSAEEKKHYITLARSSVFACVTLLEVVVAMKYLSDTAAQGYYERYEKVSKMLLGMYRSHDGK